MPNRNHPMKYYRAFSRNDPHGYYWVQWVETIGEETKTYRTMAYWDGVWIHRLGTGILSMRWYAAKAPILWGGEKPPCEGWDYADSFQYERQVLRKTYFHAKLEDDATFAYTVSQVLKDFGLTAGELGNALSVSRPTIERWAKGKTAPHLKMREPLRTFALRKIDRG